MELILSYCLSDFLQDDVSKIKAEIMSCVDEDSRDMLQAHDLVVHVSYFKVSIQSHVVVKLLIVIWKFDIQKCTWEIFLCTLFEINKIIKILYRSLYMLVVSNMMKQSDSKLCPHYLCQKYMGNVTSYVSISLLYKIRYGI